MRGEWAESVFMARAGELGFAVSRPWGDSRSFDFVVGQPGHFVSVQVKSTVCRAGGGYECCIKGKKDEPYEPGSFDFLAAYVVLEDVWYILPAAKVAGRETVCLFSKSKYARYEDYQEAWQLLREASESKGTEAGAGELTARGAAAPQFSPFSAFGRLEAAMKQFEQRLTGKVGPPKQKDEV